MPKFSITVTRIVESYPKEYNFVAGNKKEFIAQVEEAVAKEDWDASENIKQVIFIGGVDEYKEGQSKNAAEVIKSIIERAMK